MLITFPFRIPKKRSLDFDVKAEHFKTYSSAAGITNDVLVYTSGERKAYYNYVKCGELFKCGRCRHMGSESVTGRLDVDSNSTETFWLGKNPHVCEPYESPGLEVKDVVQIVKFLFIVIVYLLM